MYYEVYCNKRKRKKKNIPQSLQDQKANRHTLLCKDALSKATKNISNLFIQGRPTDLQAFSAAALPELVNMARTPSAPGPFAKSTMSWSFCMSANQRQAQVPESTMGRLRVSLSCAMRLCLSGLSSSSVAFIVAVVFSRNQ